MSYIVPDPPTLKVIPHYLYEISSLERLTTNFIKSVRLINMPNSININRNNVKSDCHNINKYRAILLYILTLCCSDSESDYWTIACIRLNNNC